MTSNAMPPRLPGYDFKRRIGSGATSIVYLYRQRMPDRDVAVKVSRTVLDPYAAARYRIEDPSSLASQTHLCRGFCQ